MATGGFLKARGHPGRRYGLFFYFALMEFIQFMVSSSGGVSLLVAVQVAAGPPGPADSWMCTLLYQVQAAIQHQKVNVGRSQAQQRRSSHTCTVECQESSSSSSSSDGALGHQLLS